MSVNVFSTKHHPFLPQQPRKYSEDAKRRLLVNLDIELADRIRRFEHALSDVLARFKSQQESQIVRIPKAVRSISMREFGDRYNGDVQACLQGLQRRKQGDEPESITPAVRKRKWQEATEAAGESGPQTKTARTTTSPQKTIPRANPGTPKNSARRPLQPNGRMNSPSKVPHPLANQFKPPSAQFNPELPHAPAYPSGRPLEPTTGRHTTNVHGLRRESSIRVKKSSSFLNGPKGSKTLRGQPSAVLKQGGVILVPTTDGHDLEFDPFITTPTEIDALEDVSDSAKKRAKEEVFAFISAQMAKWTLGP